MLRTTAFAFAIILVGCDDPAACVTGATQVCTCTTGETGAQSCQADGTFGECMCTNPMVDAGDMDRDAGDGDRDAGDTLVDGGGTDAGGSDAGPSGPFGADIGYYLAANQRWTARTNIGGGSFDMASRFDMTNVTWDTVMTVQRPLVGDFDGDGITDLGVIGDIGFAAALEFRRSSGGANTTFSASSVGGLRDLGTIPVVSGDFNGDGHDDLAQVNVGGSGTGRPANWFFAVNPATCAAGDTACNDFVDPWGGSALGFGDGSVDEHPFACDFDGDGYDDIGVVEEHADRTTWLGKRNMARGEFANPARYATRFESGTYFSVDFLGVEWFPGTVVAADYDADGLCDLGISRQGRWLVRLNEGGGSFGATSYVDLVYGDQPGAVPFVGELGD